MYVCSDGKIWRIARRPAKAFALECFGDHRFIAQNQLWDADDWEVISRATGLYDIDPNIGLHASDRWRKLFVKAYFDGSTVVDARRHASEESSNNRRVACLGDG